MSNINTWVETALQDILGRDRSDVERVNTVQPSVDIHETPESLVVVAEMPGVDEKGVEVSLSEDRLIVVGRPAEETPPAARTYREREAGPYRREFRINVRAFAREKIDAVMKNGLLRVTLPKAAEVKPHPITVRGA